MVARRDEERRAHRDRLMKEQGGLCFYCDVPLVLPDGPGGGSPNTATMDHIVPRSKARGVRNNIVVACFTCNNRKGSRSAEQFLREMASKRLRKRCASGNVMEP